MIRSYLKIAWRSIFMNKTFSSINILGLALGMTCSLLIMLWVNDELQIDSFHENQSQLYTIIEKQYHDGIVQAQYSTPGIMADEMKVVLPEVQYATNLSWRSLNTFEYDGKVLKEEGTNAGEDFFKIFSYPLLQGKAETALKDPLDIAISEKMASDFFGSAEEAIGKSIRYQNKKDLKVMAVFKNVTASSSLKFDYVLNWQTFLEENDWAKHWGNNGPNAYVMLKKGTNPIDFESKIKHFIDRYNKPEENFRTDLHIQKYGDRYLHSNFKDGELTGGRIQYVKLFSVIAVFVLLIACINFMNLTTARSIKRGKEIGVRKVVGAARGPLIRQFIGEAMMIVSISFVLALIFVFLSLPLFNEITGKQIEVPISNIYFWSSLVLLTVITGFISGSYPALYLSSFNPVRVLKGSMRYSLSALWLRKGLVIFQFVLSIMLIIGTIVISRQVNFVQSVSLGYDRENLIYLPMEGDLSSKYKLFKEKALTLQGIQSVTKMTQNPTSIQNGTSGVQWDGKDPSNRIQFTQAGIGYDFIKTMNAEIVAGRDFSETFASDSAGYIVNETALKLFNYENPIGMPLTFWEKKGTIVGVVKDFHFVSLHEPIGPIVLRMEEKAGYGGALIKTEPGKTKEALASLERLTKELNPQFPFSYLFMDEEYAKLYRSEQIVSDLSNGFAFLAIFISCLGLLGLAMFTAEQRTKEIGIRKVLGASMVSLFNLLSRELLVLVTLSMIIASPIAWYAMNSWLSEFAYRIDIAWWIFVIAGLLAIIIALVTISFQTVRALVANPVQSLRSE